MESRKLLSSPNPDHLFQFSFFAAHRLKPLRAQQLLDSACVLIVFASQQAQLIELLLQLFLSLPALLIHAVALDSQQIDSPTDNCLRSQQRQQLPVFQHAVIGPMAGQQALQRSFLFVEAVAFGVQRLQ
jgi:hypothetical protein